MTFAYYAGPEAVKGLQKFHDKGEKGTKNALKKLDGILLPEFYEKVAEVMQEEKTTLKSLPNSIDDIILDQLVLMHLDHPHNGQYVLTRSRGGPGHGTLRWTRTSEQAGKALRSQGHHCARVM